MGDLLKDLMALALDDSVCEVKAPKFSSSKGSCLGSLRSEPVFEENASKELDPSRFLTAIAAKGSKSAATECW